MSAREIVEWHAYETVFGPIGAERYDHLAAMLAQRITAMLQMSGKTPSIKEFYPRWDREEISSDGKYSQSDDPSRDRLR